MILIKHATLYKMLILDAKNDPPDLKAFKQQLYELLYMDNGAFTKNCASELKNAIPLCKSIFSNHKFELQQLVTNVPELQREIDQAVGEETPEIVPLFGMQFDRIQDKIAANPLHLELTADTPRLILQSIARNFDIFNINVCILNRARLFMQTLQTTPNLNWDLSISREQKAEWSKIARQVNATPQIFIPRMVGERDDYYKLIGFTDSSKLIAGTAIYLYNITRNTVSFILAKNRLLSTVLKSKTIPTLEMYAVYIRVSTIVDLYEELCGQLTFKPIKIVGIDVYTDSLICLNWIALKTNKLKLPCKNIFVLNRLNKIEELCQKSPITFHHISSESNCADRVSRPTSYRQLQSSNFVHGPEFLTKSADPDESLIVTVPNPEFNTESNAYLAQVALESEATDVADKQLIPIRKFSSFRRLIKVTANVLKFVHNLKLKIKKAVDTDQNFFEKATNLILLREQTFQFPEIFAYLESKQRSLKYIPILVTQLNLEIGKDNLLRIKGKCNKGKDQKVFNPILLKKSDLSEVMVRELHEVNAHFGKYPLIAEVRKQFYIVGLYMLAKTICSSCIVCKRYNSKTIALNQNDYRDFRINPPEIPYRSIFIDHLGPIIVKINGTNQKVYLLTMTCMWSRSVSIQICRDLTVQSFIRALSIHCLEWGVAELILSDAGSQIKAGAQIISDFLKDIESENYLKCHNIKKLTFDQYFTGNSSLGSCIEILNKQIKKMVYSSIKKTVLDYPEFEYLVHYVTHLVNRRPIALQSALRDGPDGPYA